MRIDILTVLPEMVAGALEHSIIKRARERGLITINVVNLRDFTFDRHKTTDDQPYGGGGGMIMKIEPIARALAHLTNSGSVPNSSIQPTYPAEHSPPSPYSSEAALSDFPDELSISEFETNAPQNGVNEVKYTADSIGSLKRPRIVLTDPRGPRFTQVTAQQWAREEHLILLCGHYEGVDERVRQHLVTDEISLGDYILTGGELPALIIADALTRLQPDALGDSLAPDKDTFADNLLEYPHYTRPRDFQGWSAPDILMCGHHAEIERWRRWHQFRATRERRPDLFARLNLSAKDWKLIEGEEPTAPPDSKAAVRKASAPGREAEPEQAKPDAAQSMDSIPVAPALGPDTAERIEKEGFDGTEL